jgi:hypothetical protein
VTVKPAARGGHRGAGVTSADGTGAQRRVVARSCLMLSEACGGLSSAPGCITEHRRDRRRWAAPNRGAMRNGKVRSGGRRMGREAGEGGRGMGGHRRVARSSGLADVALADGDGGTGLRRGAPDSNGVVGMERAVGFSSRRQPIASATWRRGGGGGARAAARAAALRSDSGAWRLRTEARGHGAGRPVGHGAPLWRGVTAVPPRAANLGAARGGLATDRRPHMSANFKYRKNLKIFSLHRKDRYNVRKNLEKFMEVGNPI